MHYLLLVYQNLAGDERVNQNENENEAELASYRSVDNQLVSAIRSRGTLQLTTTAKTLRMRHGKWAVGKWSVTDGPFAETKEQFGGDYPVETTVIHPALAADRATGAESIELRPS